MHTSSQLRSDHFRFTVAGEPVGFEAVLPDFTEHDRLGVVIGSDYGGAGASTVILAAVTAFYDHLRAAGDDFFAYPDFFAFQVGRPRGSLRKLDIYPAHKEIVVADDPQRILEAINDRAITRLLVEESPTADPELTSSTPAAEPDLSAEARDSARRRIRSALAYAPTGRVVAGDVVVSGSAQTEAYVEAMLAAAVSAGGGHTGFPARTTRAHLRQGGRPVESFRRISIDGALRTLSPDFHCRGAAHPHELHSGSGRSEPVN